MKRQNCWEFKVCGREAGGKYEKSMGTCPAALEDRLEGVHEGTNAGRACWVIAGTLCEGEVQGTFAKKYENCTKCDFYNKVKEEEGPSLEMSVVLLNKMRRSA